MLAGKGSCRGAVGGEGTSRRPPKRRTGSLGGPAWFSAPPLLCSSPQNFATTDSSLLTVSCGVQRGTGIAHRASVLAREGLVGPVSGMPGAPSGFWIRRGRVKRRFARIGGSSNADLRSSGFTVRFEVEVSGTPRLWFSIHSSLGFRGSYLEGRWNIWSFVGLRFGVPVGGVC